MMRSFAREFFDHYLRTLCDHTFANVRYWHKADIGLCTANVRFRGQGDIQPQRHQTEISVASVQGQAPRLPESCPENGNLPKLPLLTISSLVPSVGTKSI